MKTLDNKTTNAYNLLLQKINGLNEKERVNITKVLLFAIEKHKDQTYDWEDGKKLPYSYHVICVAINAYKFSSEGIEPILVGLLHDIIEDKKALVGEIEQLLNNQGLDKNKLVKSIILLDRTQYLSEPKGYYKEILNDENAIVVKSADLVANLQAGLDCFEDVMNSEKRLWIYKYLFEIKNYILPSDNFHKLKHYKNIRREFDAVSSNIIKRFSQKHLEEFNKFMEAQNESRN
ncbi:hypothetical protein HYX19_03675 [Candidatus Woesearchaeota archaeon]|nr:hypothetical protein [Candidatus Woesearchaeota archaeon]